MEFVALSKNVRVSPRKVRLVAKSLKGKMAVDALVRLQFLAKSSTQPLLKTLKSAMANGKNDEKLVIKNILVDEGLKMKRRDTSHGARFGGGVIVKRMAHIKIILDDMGNEPSRSLSHSQIKAHGK